ncbi:MAG TPA: Ig-like domain-containing protein, partial [Spirochaetota bacterium]|nr:Ig-like domain-containing protein [Spirochaetota bacterium]
MKKSFFLAPLFLLIFIGCYPSVSLRSIYDKEYNIPRLKNSSVKDKDIEITLRPSISFEFTESMDFYEVERYITLFKSEVDKVESKINIVNDKNIIITPIDYLMPDGTYTVKIERSLKSITGFTLPKEVKINFITTVNDTIPPKVIGTSFSDNSNDIAGNSNFIVYFSKAIDSGSLLSGIRLVDSNDSDVSIDISSSLNSVIIKPESVLKPWSDYTIKVTKDIRDETQNKNNLSQEKEYKITTKGDYRYRTTVNGSKYSFSPDFFIKSVVNKTE